MHQRITILPETLTNKIAAGEVVERPAAVIKELIENALDAGATKISVEIAAGGRRLIRITDNGYGMSREDALLSLERHATSKIKSDNDLDAMAGEAFAIKRLLDNNPRPVARDDILAIYRAAY